MRRRPRPQFGGGIHIHIHDDDVINHVAVRPLVTEAVALNDRGARTEVSSRAGARLRRAVAESVVGYNRRARRRLGREGRRMTAPREILGWDLFGTASRELATQVASSGYDPDIILAIARGGLLPAGALGYALAVKNVWTLNVEFYTGVDERLSMPIMLPPVPELIDLDHARVLIVDDVADTGKTLKLVLDFCEGKVREARVAVLYEKPRSLVKCDYAWRYTDRWINFPWSDKEPVVTREATRDA